MPESESEHGYAKGGTKAGLPWYNENIDKYLNPEVGKFSHAPPYPFFVYYPNRHVYPRSKLTNSYTDSATLRVIRQNPSGPTERACSQDSSLNQTIQSCITDHLLQRDAAWSIRTYPCTGLGVWLIPYISYSPAYSRILHQLKSDGKFMDIGCLLGGDMRILVNDGCPSSNMYGVDIVSHWDVGFDLYRDTDRFDAKFIEGDILAAESNQELAAIHGKMDVISISAVMHQWTWEKQVACGVEVVKFSSGPGAMIVGHQVGNLNPGDIEFHGIHAYKHAPESWERLWKQIGKDTGTEWKVEAGFRTFDSLKWDPADMVWMDKNERVLEFVLTRVA